MTIKTLYRYKRVDGGITVSPDMPTDRPYSILMRLIADEGKILTNGVVQTSCIDVESTTGWFEIEDTEESDDET